MARKDRHTLLMGGRSCGVLWRMAFARASLRGGVVESQFTVMGSEVRPVFFLNPCGWGSGTDWGASNFGVSLGGDRLIYEGFDPGSE